MKILSKILATFFGVGYFPIAPGTLTSLICVFIYKFYLFRLNWPFYLLFLIFLFIGGSLVSTKYSKELNRKDPRKIVIDEAFGQFLVLFRMDENWPLLLLSFFFFRLFDIIKPYPIRKVEKFPNGWGIMLDDFLAALYAGIIIYVFLLVK
jgi:phosphatidylglycerophosphatase A